MQNGGAKVTPDIVYRYILGHNVSDHKLYQHEMLPYVS